MRPPHQAPLARGGLCAWGGPELRPDSVHAASGEPRVREQGGLSVTWEGASGDRPLDRVPQLEERLRRPPPPESKLGRLPREWRDRGWHGRRRPRSGLARGGGRGGRACSGAELTAGAGAGLVRAPRVAERSDLGRYGLGCSSRLAGEFGFVLGPGNQVRTA